MILTTLLKRIPFRRMRLAVSVLMLVAVVIVWVRFELGQIARGEPKLVTRLSIVALIYEAYNAISINTAD